MISAGSRLNELAVLDAKSSGTRSVMACGLSRKWNAFDVMSGVVSSLRTETCRGFVVYLNVFAE
jgi:hypothetical protein